MFSLFTYFFIYLGIFTYNISKQKVIVNLAPWEADTVSTLQGEYQDMLVKIPEALYPGWTWDVSLKERLLRQPHLSQARG